MTVLESLKFFFNTPSVCTYVFLIMLIFGWIYFLIWGRR